MFGNGIDNPYGWPVEKLGIACDVRDGTHDTPKYHDEGYPLVTSKNVTGGVIDFSTCNLISEKDYLKIKERSGVDEGDIIMPMIGTVGNPIIVDTKREFAIKNVALIKFREESKVLNSYIVGLLQSSYFDEVVLSNLRGGNQKFVSLTDMRGLDIVIPPMCNQKQYGRLVEQSDKSKYLCDIVRRFLC